MEWSAGIAAHATRKRPPARDTRRSYRTGWWPAAPDERSPPPPPVSSQIFPEDEQARDPRAEQPERRRLGRKVLRVVGESARNRRPGEGGSLRFVIVGIEIVEGIVADAGPDEVEVSSRSSRQRSAARRKHGIPEQGESARRGSDRVDIGCVAGPQSEPRAARERAIDAGPANQADGRIQRIDLIERVVHSQIEVAAIQESQV